MRLPICLLLIAISGFAADLRIGIVGTDTSHVTAFTKMLNDPAAPDHIGGARIVGAFKGGSPDLPESANRVEQYAHDIESKWGVKIYSDIPSLCRDVDAVLLESVDGRVHLAQFKQILPFHKPVFIDKPLAGSLAEAREIARLAREAGVPWFSSSSLRFGEIGTTMKFSDAKGVMTWGPGPVGGKLELELAWYAIHPIEMLYALMGPGCDSVSRNFAQGTEVIVGKWKDGRLGTVRTLKPYGGYGAVVFREKAVAQSRPDTKEGYAPLVVKIVEFFQTGKPPVPNDETLEIFSFMDAAQHSGSAGGAPQKLR